ncbi:MAG TPA: peptide ABC transporter substrate-binding protein [Candidatus Krumholzibacteriaceae bacterium]
MMLRRVGISILCVTIAFGAGCGRGDKSGARGGGSGSGPGVPPGAIGAGPERPVRGGRLVIGMQQEPEILNEAVNSMVASVYVCSLIFSKFVKYNDSMELVPDLIEEIPTVENGGISPDYLTYTYHIRKNARWHDGVSVTSYDAKFSYEVMMHPDINVETRQGWDVVDRVETPDSHTVVFHLREVYANFVGDCFYDESVLPEHLLRGSLGPQFQNAAFHRHPVGSGPFVFKEWVSGSHIIVRANKDYYGEGPYLDEIVIKFIPDGNALVMQLETGEIAAIDNAPNTALPVVERMKGVRLFRNPALFNEHLDLNCENAILGDRLVRRALALATNRKELADRIYKGVWLPAYGDDHPRSPYYTTAVETLNAFDPARAENLLTKAGWVDRNGDGIREKNGTPLALTISATTGNLDRERSEMVLREEYRSIGVDLAVKNYSPGELYASWDEGGILRRGKYDIALYAALMPPDPSTKEGTYSAAFIPPKGQNFTRIRNERLTRLLGEGSRTVVFADRKRIYDEISRIVADEAPAIPLLWVTQLDVMPEALVNYRPNPTQSGDTWNANEWWLKK